MERKDPAGKKKGFCFVQLKKKKKKAYREPHILREQT